MESSTQIKTAPGPVRDWIDAHDDRWTFWLLYIGGSVLLSVFASLFWVAMMVVFHLGLEIIRHKDLGPLDALRHGFWHLKLDISLILFALVLSLYGDMVFAALGLGQAARAAHAVRGMQMATRFAILERGIRVFLLTVDDMARVMGVVARLVLNRKAADKPVLRPHPADPAQPVIKAADTRHWARLGAGDIAVLAFGGICVMLILAAPVFLDQGAMEIIARIIKELSP